MHLIILLIVSTNMYVQIGKTNQKCNGKIRFAQIN